MNSGDRFSKSLTALWQLTVEFTKLVLEVNVDCENVVFSSHAIRQMFFRRISQEQVKSVIAYGEVIEETPDDEPFPSYLLLDTVQGLPIHVVISQDIENQTCYVVTACVPGFDLWRNNFRVRK